MIQTVQMKIIARIHSDFDEKFGIPRQSGLVDSLRAKIVFEPEFRAAEAVRGLEGFSPFRPNAIGLSCVRLDHIEPQTPEGPVIWVRGADLLDGSPIFDIKPYLPYADAHPEALGGFALQEKEGALRIVFPEELLARVPEELRQGLCDVLRQDPRPGYQDEPGRRYGMAFAGFDVRFTVENGVLTVVEVAEK